MSALNTYDEKAVVSRLVAGDGEAFATLFGHYRETLGRFLLRFVKSPQMAEDLYQEVFLKIWEQRAHLSELQSFRAFLFVVARNHTLKTLKKAARSQAAMGEIAHHVLAVAGGQSAGGRTDDIVLTREYQLFVERVIEGMPLRTREVFRLCREQQLSYDQVAARLGISRNAVKNHMVLSMKILKTSVEKDLGISLSLFFLILYGA